LNIRSGGQSNIAAPLRPAKGVAPNAAGPIELATWYPNSDAPPRIVPLKARARFLGESFAVSGDSIIEKWLERHPELKNRTEDIQVSRGTMRLSHGGKTDLIRATIIFGADIEGYDPAQDFDLYEYFLSDDQGDRKPSQSG